MVWIPGGTFLMGSDHHYPEEAPAHEVTVDAFWMDRSAVTKREFHRFVDATGYVTFAEEPLPSEERFAGCEGTGDVKPIEIRGGTDGGREEAEHPHHLG